MTKKTFKIIIATVLAMLTFITAVFAETGNVEIRFFVGDDVLIINGEEVQVEKPYIVGDGVTLVPVRVITEAFGAKVNWEQSTKTVTLDYPDVKIILQIDNLVAEVNGMAVTLESAPELTDSGFTMVPLRFISENFGAEVGYDHATAGIVVTKEKTEAGNTVEGAVDSKYVGDSYYNWYMETPLDMIMSERYFDGTYTSFSYDENNWVDIDVIPKADDYDFNGNFQMMKSYFSGYTLTKADKVELDNGLRYMHLQAKDKTDIADYYEYETEDYIYTVRAGITNDHAEKRDELLRIFSTFTLGYTDEAYDLSNAKNGVRTLNVESMKLSFDVPEEFIMLNDEDAENKFVFISGHPDDDVSGITGAVYSKSSFGTAKEGAKRDYERNKRALNENVATFDREVTAMNYNNISAYQYGYEVNTKNASSYTLDVFFEIGEYVYNFSYTIKLPSDTYEIELVEFFNSIKAEKLDPDEIGVILYTEEEIEGTFVADELNKCKFSLPNRFVALSESKTECVYTDGTIIVKASAYMDEDYTKEDIRKSADSFIATKRKTEGVKIEQLPVERHFGSNDCIVCAYQVEDEETGILYVEMFMMARNNIAYIFEVAYPEAAYSDYAQQSARSIISSLVFR